jgi:hypothetical protein
VGKPSARASRGQRPKRRKPLDREDADPPQARGKGELACPDHGPGPEADGLAFCAAADEVEQVSFEQKHAKLATCGDVSAGV